MSNARTLANLVPDGLDDYEEGTFTPILQGGTNTGLFNYTTSVGWYRKVGNLVTAFISIAATTNSGDLPTGELQVANMPFIANHESIGTFQVNDMGSSYQPGVGQYSSIIQPGNSFFHFRGTNTSGAAYSSMQVQSMAYLRVTISYTIS